MEAEDLFSLGIDKWLLSEEEEETAKLMNEEEIRQLVKEEKHYYENRELLERMVLVVSEKRQLENIPMSKLNNLPSKFFIHCKEEEW